MNNYKGSAGRLQNGEEYDLYSDVEPFAGLYRFCRAF